jgi:hypothetical protein
MQDMDLGEFGVVSVLELLDYFLENPPKKTTVETKSTETHFQGC